MGLVGQWDDLARRLAPGWTEVELTLVPTTPESADRAAALLGPIGPGRAGSKLRLSVSAADGGPAQLRRLLARLDAESIRGSLELVAAEAAVGDADRPDDRPNIGRADKALADAWDELAASLPEDWSDLLCALELRSTDDLSPAALAIAPLNPSRYGSAPVFRFRVARRFGYGAAAEMARRCLARLDEREICGTVRLVEALSDTRPVATQGPTFIVSGRAV